MEAYLDNAATTQAFDEVCREVEKVMMIDFGNPSSKHTKGMQAENYINEAKENIAATLKCQPRKLYLRPAEQNQIIWHLSVRC